jgi:aminopeptidase N
VYLPNRTARDLNEVVFRLYPNLPQYGGRLNVNEVWVDGEHGTAELRSAATSLVVLLAQPLPPGAGTTVSMTFDIYIPQPSTDYVLFGHSQGIWSLPDAYPLLAAHDGSAWHEDVAPPHGDAVYADAALYDVTLRLPPELILATTGSVLSQEMVDSGQSVYHVVGGPLREFAWLASSVFEVIEDSAFDVGVRSFFLPGDRSAGQAALSTAAAALRTYNQAYGPYPFPELIIVEAPLGIYGMEYPGMNLIGVDLYRSQGMELEIRVAHEVAHQWWYSQVGNDQVNTPWLDEGLTEYSTAEYYRQVYGQARANTVINQRWLVPYQAAVEDGWDAAVNQPSAAFGPEYEVIVYAKAALFFDALQREVGDDTYRAILQEYLSRYRWRVATPDSFLKVAEQISGQDLSLLYDQWILSTR